MPSIYGEYVKRSRLRLDYSYTQNIVNNTTTFTLTLYAEKPSGMGTHSYSYHDSIYAISGKDGNQLINETGDWSWGNVTEYKVAESTYTYTHNSDGTGSCSLGAAWITGLTSSSVVGYRMEVYGTVTLPTIPRKSSMTVSIGTINETNPTFTINRKSNSFTHTLKYITPGTSTEVQIATGVGTSYNNWTPPSTLYQYFPNSPHITLTYKIYTYNGSTLVGSDTATGTINANQSDCTPTLSVTVTPTDYSSLTGSTTTIIKDVSNVTISATATAKNSASIKSITTNGTTLSTNNTTGSGILYKVETGTFKTTATDSRGFPKTDINGEDNPYTVVNYVPLTISAEVVRTNATSSTIKATIKGKYFNGSFGSATNTLTLTWKYKLRSASDWSIGGTLTATITNNEYTTGEVTLGTNFSYENDYDFLFTAVDKIYTSGVSTSLPVNKGMPIFDYGVDANGDNYFNVNGDIYRNNENILQRNIITIGKNSNQDVAANQSPIIVQMNLQRNKIGSKLTFTNNSVKIGSGVNYVLVSGLCWAEAHDGYKWVIIRKKEGSTYTDISSAITPKNTLENWDSASLPPVLIQVAEGDEISMWIVITGTATGRIAAGEYTEASTYLTVEVVG